MKKIIVIGGGTMSHVRNHLSLCAPAFGETARQLEHMLCYDEKLNIRDYDVQLFLTRMADPRSSLVTNDDISDLLDRLIADPDVRAIIFNPALVDFDGHIQLRWSGSKAHGFLEQDTQSGKHAQRLKTEQGEHTMTLTPSAKLIGKIRKTRKDIFVVGFKTTTGATEAEQYGAALKLLKTNSLNLVLANDTVNRRNFIVAPEETIYRVPDETQFGARVKDRTETLQLLVDMTLSRITNTFTRSTVVPGEAVPWDSDLVPANLREVVDFCIKEGAYKTVLGKTAGHFAVKLSDTEVLTSIRKSNFNELAKVGMVKIVSTGPDNVTAYGFKPSVGGQSQRIVFSEHQDVDCIVHFHCPPKPGYDISTRPQWPNECGSHQCGQNTSDGLQRVDLGDGDTLKVVNLDNHGPNIVFSRSVPTWKVKQFIGDNFHLNAKTGGLVPAGAQ